jgi:hypothetical protein
MEDGPLLADDVDGDGEQEHEALGDRSTSAPAPISASRC